MDTPGNKLLGMVVKPSGVGGSNMADASGARRDSPRPNAISRYIVGETA